MKMPSKEVFRGGLLGTLVKLVVFVVATVLAMTVLANTIRGGSQPEGTEYSAVFTDATMSQKGDDVRIAGVVVGKVTKVELHERDKALVHFTLDGDRTLPDTTHATLRFRNLIGQRYLALSREPGKVGPTLEPGSTIGLEHTTPAVDLTALFDGFRPLFSTLQPEDVNALADSLIKVLQGEGGTVASLVRQTGELTNTLADRDRVIGEVIDNLTVVLETINDRDREFDQLIVNTRQLIEGLAQEKTAVGSSVDSIAQLTSAAENVVGATRPQVTDSLRALDKVTTDAVANQKKLEDVLHNLPLKTEKLVRTASFGSWYQFYLCGIDVTAGPGSAPNLVSPPVPRINQPIYTNAAPRCSTGGGR